MMTGTDEIDRATTFYECGAYCSQAILMTFCERYGLDTDTAFRLSCGLNSGVRCAEACGAVTGAVLVIGLKYGSSSDECNVRTEEFIRLFRERNGSVVCRDIIGCDIFTPEGRDRAVRDGLFGTVCRDAVADAARILTELGY